MCSFEAFVEMKEIEAPKVKLDRKPEPARAAVEPPKKEVSTRIPDESIKDHLPVHSEPSRVEPASQLETTQIKPPEPVRKQVAKAPPEVTVEPTRKQPPQEVFKAEAEPPPKPSELPKTDQAKKQVPPKSEPTPKISEPTLAHKKEGRPQKGIIRSSLLCPALMG